MTYGFHFPIAPIDEALKSPMHDPAIRRPILLIVDDEELIVTTLSTILCRAGFTVLTAHDGASALEIAKVIPPDLLISDVAMPGMNGVELAVSITCMLRDAKVILFSAHAQPKDLELAREAGFEFPLLTKPVHPKLMLSYIHRCLKDSADATSMPPIVEFPVRFELAS